MKSINTSTGVDLNLTTYISSNKTFDRNDIELQLNKELDSTYEVSANNGFQIHGYINEGPSLISSEHELFVGATENWTDIDIIDARLIEIEKDVFTLDCLIDTENKIFETREFHSSIIPSYQNIELGDFFIIRIFTKPGKQAITINKDNSISRKNLFNDPSRYNDLDDYKFEKF